VPCIVLQGRRHLYEGYRAAEVAFPVRVLLRLGIRALVLTNAAGGVDPALLAGDLMIIDDHINLLWANPLEGPVQSGETRFPDLSDVYDPALQRLAEQVALAARIRVVRGVYCAVTGPSYETPAEVRMLRTLGADVVGMSTVLEVIAAHHMGVRCACISLASNLGAGILPVPLDHTEVLAAGREAAGRLRELFTRVLSDPELPRGARGA
jgi:purine-nucleoside phosphorylase